jgi:hypothetical protein
MDLDLLRPLIVLGLVEFLPQGLQLRDLGLGAGCITGFRLAERAREGDHRFSPWEALPPKNGIAGVVRLAASDQFRRSMA